MIQSAELDRCLSFINCQLQPATGSSGSTANGTQPMAVTLSRQAGCGALVIAGKLADMLQKQSPKAARPWTVFDRNLMAQVLEDHHLPARLAKYLPEDRMTEIQDIMDDLFGVLPPSWTMVQQTSETILRLAELGSAILIGRGASIITARLPNVFHVRLIAPLNLRIDHAHEVYGMSLTAARAFCLREDRGRQRYLKKYFKADIDDPLLYQLTINTGSMSYDQAARIIANAVLDRRSVDRSEATQGRRQARPPSNKILGVPGACG